MLAPIPPQPNPEPTPSGTASPGPPAPPPPGTRPTFPIRIAILLGATFLVHLFVTAGMVLAVLVNRPGPDQNQARGREWGVFEGKTPGQAKLILAACSLLS